MTNGEPIRYECPSCGHTYFPTSQSEDCPHEYASSFTQSMRTELRKLLHKESAK